MDSEGASNSFLWDGHFNQFGDDLNRSGYDPTTPYDDSVLHGNPYVGNAPFLNSMPNFQEPSFMSSTHENIQMNMNPTIEQMVTNMPSSPVMRRTTTNKSKSKSRQKDSQSSGGNARIVREGSYACPLFQHNNYHNQKHVCKGVKARKMADVRTHMTSGRNKHVEFLVCCPVCSEDVLNREEFEESHGYKGEYCRKAPSRPRGGDASEIQWKKLYRKLYPMEKHIPEAFNESHAGTRESQSQRIRKKRPHPETSSSDESQRTTLLRDFPNSRTRPQTDDVTRPAEVHNGVVQSLDVSETDTLQRSGRQLALPVSTRVNGVNEDSRHSQDDVQRQFRNLASSDQEITKRNEVMNSLVAEVKDKMGPQSSREAMIGIVVEVVARIFQTTKDAHNDLSLSNTSTCPELEQGGSSPSPSSHSSYQLSSEASASSTIETDGELEPSSSIEHS